LIEGFIFLLLSSTLANIFYLVKNKKIIIYWYFKINQYFLPQEESCCTFEQ
jgi:hypothetical protein